MPRKNMYMKKIAIILLLLTSLLLVGCKQEKELTVENDMEVSVVEVETATTEMTTTEATTTETTTETTTTEATTTETTTTETTTTTTTTTETTTTETTTAETITTTTVVETKIEVATVAETSSNTVPAIVEIGEGETENISNEGYHPVSASSDSYWIYYTQWGEGLIDIASRYYFSDHYALAAYNGINPNELLVYGQPIRIPYEYSDWGSSGMYDYDWSDYTNDWSDYTDYTDNEWNDYTSTDWNDYTTDWGSYENYGYSDGSVWSSEIYLENYGIKENSWQNVQLSASMLNGFTLGPGQSFNWFNDMGPCSYEDGFVDSAAYVPGGVAPGGGICMTATGLYQAALASGCTNFVRCDHDGPIDYAVVGYNDAAVSYGSSNLCFTNPSSTSSITFWFDTSSYGYMTVSTSIS